jgi:hypothetical protein
MSKNIIFFNLFFNASKKFNFSLNLFSRSNTSSPSAAALPEVMLDCGGDEDDDEDKNTKIRQVKKQQPKRKWKKGPSTPTT